MNSAIGSSVGGKRRKPRCISKAEATAISKSPIVRAGKGTPRAKRLRTLARNRITREDLDAWLASFKVSKHEPEPAKAEDKPPEPKKNFPAAARGLAAFSGVDRRFTVRGEENGVLVVDEELAALHGQDGVTKGLVEPGELLMSLFGRG
ncbi:MAG: hypothetical protein HC783_13415 [Rhodobacteraceae bacterium]|nr:hypothetical protein [Paracoccaceae bacterium]